MATEIMTVEELAEYLRLDPQTVYRKFRRGEIPGVKIGKAIRFKRDIVEGWLRAASFHWDTGQRKELRRWAAGFAKKRGLHEEKVLASLRERRYGRR